MAKVTVLGGCGAVGSVAVRALARHDAFDQVVIADANTDGAKQLTEELQNPKVSWTALAAEDGLSVRDAIRGSSVVLNCVGPFYKTVKTVFRAALEARVDYVDVCDDVDVTLELLSMDEQARQAGVRALIGMGNSPGATNLLARLAHDTLLDETDSIDIFHAHGGEPIEGPGVIGHRFHCMTIDIPMFLDGKLVHVKYFEPDGIALRQTFDFPVLGSGIPLYPYPHPEQVTLPRYLKLRQVTNKGAVLPSEYYNLTRDLVQLGMADHEPVRVNGFLVAPYDFAISYILRERERILKETAFGQQRGCCTVVAKGKRHGAYREYRFHMASQSQALGEGTGIPAVVGAILIQRGKVAGPGVLPPEAAVNPADFLEIVPTVMDMDKRKEGGRSFGGIIVQMLDDQGRLTNVDLG